MTGHGADIDEEWNWSETEGHTVQDSRFLCPLIIFKVVPSCKLLVLSFFQALVQMGKESILDKC